MPSLPHTATLPATTGLPVARGDLVRTVEIDDPGPLPARLPEGMPITCWVRDGDGVVGWGERATFSHVGVDAARLGARWWQRFANGLRISDEVAVAGTGPIAFGSVAFDQRSGSSTLVVPRVVLGRSGGRAWLTSYDGDEPALPAANRLFGPTLIGYSDGAVDAAAWGGIVAETVRRIKTGQADKVVLARELIADTDPPVDPRFLLNWLGRRYASSWTYAVDGLIGATPELLVRCRGSDVDSRVLAGTARSGSPEAATLLTSAKDREEHEYAVRSTADLITTYCASLEVPDAPSLLELPNVTHLESVLRGALAAPISSLELAGALHPTAAVCGTPTEVALELITELEHLDRGRYAGPVGWIDAAGDGDWGIALRCATVTGSGRVRMYAGCGIVADSEPDAEVAESIAKFVVMRDALEARSTS